jgi:hypothetical protein
VGYRACALCAAGFVGKLDAPVGSFWAILCTTMDTSINTHPTFLFKTLSIAGTVSKDPEDPTFSFTMIYVPAPVLTVTAQSIGSDDGTLDWYHHGGFNI